MACSSKSLSLSQPTGKDYYDQFHHNFNLGLERLFYPINFSYPVDEDDRSTLIDWCYTLVRKFKFNHMTFELAISLIDRYLSQVTEEENLGLLGLSSLYLANIYTETDALSIDDFKRRAQGKSINEIIKFCLNILKRLNYKIKIPLYHDFFSPHSFYLTKTESDFATYLIYSSLHSFDIIQHPPSSLSSAAIWLSHLMLTPEEEDDLDWYLQWFQGSLGKIPDLKVVLDLLDHTMDKDDKLPSLRRFFDIPCEKPDREAIIQQMESMLDKIVFDFQGQKTSNIEIEEEIQAYQACNFPKSERAHKQYINKYVLSDGAYGKVFKGYCTTGKREDVAIKKFFDDDPEEMSSSTLREFDSHLSFNHPNIATIKDIFYRKKHFYLVMELYGGGDFFDYLRKKKLPTFPNKWIPQLLEAVNYLHKRNWIQRDLKTANLLLDQDKNLILTDFGLSRRDYYGELTHEERQKQPAYTPDMMTLNYRAPEMLFGDNRYDLKVDCWSAGCIIGEIYLRSSLFPGDDELEVVKEIFKNLGFPDNQATWPKRYENWYIWKEHFAHYTDPRIKSRFDKKNISVPDNHWHIFLKLLELNVEERWYCIDCLNYLNK